MYTPKNPSELRNGDVRDRSKLVNNPGQRYIEGLSQSGDEYEFTGSCFGTKVHLGEIRDGRKGASISLGGIWQI